MTPGQVSVPHFKWDFVLGNSLLLDKEKWLQHWQTLQADSDETDFLNPLPGPPPNVGNNICKKKKKKERETRSFVSLR